MQERQNRCVYARLCVAQIFTITASGESQNRPYNVPQIVA